MLSLEKEIEIYSLLERTELINEFLLFFTQISFPRMNALEASNYEIGPLWEYVKEADKCFEEAKIAKKQRKASTLYHLTKYLVQDKNKRK